MERKLIIKGIACVMMLLIVAFMISGNAWGKKIVLKFSSHFPVGSPADQAMTKWAELVKERSNGRIEVQHFGASQLGHYKDMVEQCRLGTIQGATTNPGGIAQLVPEFGILSAPYLFKDAGQYERVVRGPIGKELEEKLAKQANLRAIAMFWFWGLRHFTTNKPVFRPEDMKGMKIRVPNTPIHVEFIRALKATPTPMDITEVYTSLQTGVVDAQENPPDNTRSYNFHEVQKYLILDGHLLDYHVLFLNEKFWQSLTADDQKIIATSMREAEDWQNEVLGNKQNKSLVWLQEKGKMQVLVPDSAAFRDAALQHFPGPFKDKWGDTWKKINEMP
jgi:tripartite ATP-independent transporter DctP family solute receptor